MKTIVRLIASITAGGCLLNAVAAERVSPSGETQLHIEIRGHAVSATIRTMEIPIDRNMINHQRQYLGCTLSRFPCTLIQSLEIAVDGKRVFVPSSALAATSDVFSAELGGSGSEYELLINGGDASESYVTTIRFNSKRVVSRSTASQLDRNRPLEETKYFVSTEDFDN